MHTYAHVCTNTHSLIRRNMRPHTKQCTRTYTNVRARVGNRTFILLVGVSVSLQMYIHICMYIHVSMRVHVDIHPCYCDTTFCDTTFIMS